MRMRTRTMSAVAGAAWVSSVLLVLLAAGTLGPAAADVSGPFKIPSPVTGLETATVSVSDTGHRVMLAWMESDGVYAAVTTSEDAMQGNIGRPTKVFNQTLAEGGSVSIDMNQAGFTGWVLISKATVVSGGARCAISAIRWNAAFGIPNSVITLDVADKSACDLKSMKLTVSDDGSRVAAAFAYRYKVASDAAKALLLAWTAKEGWQPVSICCNDGMHTQADPAKFAVTADAIGNTMVVSYVASKGDETYELRTSAYNGKDLLYSASSPIEGDAEVSVATTDNGNEVLTLVNNGSSINAVTYVVDAQQQETRGVVLMSSSGLDIDNVHHAVINDNDVTLAYQLRDLHSTKSFLCQVTLDSLTCTSPMHVHERPSDSPADEVAVAGFSSTAVVVYTSGVGTVSSASHQKIGGLFGFPAAKAPLDDVTLNSTGAGNGYCSVTLETAVMRANGSAIALWTGKVCTDGCAVCATPAYEAWFALWQSGFDKGFACTPQFVCAKQGGSFFPSKRTCSAGCDQPQISDGYVCTDSGECKRADVGAYPTMDTCLDVCVPLKRKYHAPISGGSVFLLVLFFGFAVPYFVGGMVYNKFMYNASGVELLPHAEFWTQSLPRAIADGARFATCRHHGGQTYTEI